MNLIKNNHKKINHNKSINAQAFHGFLDVARGTQGADLVLANLSSQDASGVVVRPGRVLPPVPTSASGWLFFFTGKPDTR